VAIYVFLDANVTINGVDLSGKSTKVTLKIKADDKDTSAFGATYRNSLGGLRDTDCSIEFNQDFAAAQVDATLFPLLGTVSTVTVKATSAANSATNPQYSQSMLLKEYDPIGGAVGDKGDAVATFVGAGTLTRLVV
jgi:hypothetical protein